VSSVQKKKSSVTAQLSRTHEIEISKNGLVSLMGGKWTSYRCMGEETVDEILKHNKNIETKYKKSRTMEFNLIGSYSETNEDILIEFYEKDLI
jgi:glycerol-3-phosphate dehydrogenase